LTNDPDRTLARRPPSSVRVTVDHVLVRRTVEIPGLHDVWLPGFLFALGTDSLRRRVLRSCLELCRLRAQDVDSLDLWAIRPPIATPSPKLTRQKSPRFKRSMYPKTKVWAEVVFAPRSDGLRHAQPRGAQTRKNPPDHPTKLRYGSLGNNRIRKADDRTLFGHP
jgi:hypothetical protein